MSSSKFDFDDKVAFDGRRFFDSVKFDLDESFSVELLSFAMLPDFEPKLPTVT